MKGSMFGGLTLKELAKRTWSESSEDNVFGGAAELAYYFMLALFPMLIFLTSLVGFVPGAQEAIFNALSKVVPAEAWKLVSETLTDVITNSSGGLLSFGILGTIWAASSGVSSVMGTLNTAYDAKEERSFVKMRLTAIGLTLALALLVMGGAVLIMFSHTLSDWFTSALGFGSLFKVISTVVGYIIAIGLLFFGIGLLYFFGPNVKQAWHWVTPGAVFAVAAIIIGSLLFSVYLKVGPGYSATYGSLGAVIILMLWLYLVGLVLLVGGEVNSEVEHASGKPTIQAESGKPSELQAA
jgi:membrane protein